MGVALALALTTFAAAHIALIVGFARQRAWWRAALAFFIAPLAPWWGYRAGMRARTAVWGAALVLYGAGVALVQ
jgi:hypothetical protein